MQAVRITGPFQPLASGAKLVDLPGINDPNEAREEVTRQHIKSCRFVWLVFNVKRVLTRDTIAIIQSEDFLRQIVMDGRAGALTFVGTHSDDIDPESGREEFGLDEDATEFEVVQARNSAVRKEVKRQLAEVADRLQHNARESAQQSRVLREAFDRCQVFTISAREYLRLRGLAKTRSAGLESPEQTEIPTLLGHMDLICADYSVEARARAHHRQIDLVLEEAANLAAAQRLQSKELATVSEGQRKEIRAAAQAARAFLHRATQGSLGALSAGFGLK